ncbi:phage major capsid protein [Salipiger pacificus]|nr:phage major capsid protein [Alloyangia pacifica]
MTINVARMKQTRAEKIDAMEAIVSKAEKEDRGFDEAEQEAYDELNAEVGDLAKRIERAERVAEMKGSVAKPVGGVSKAAQAAAGAGDQVEVEEEAEPKGKAAATAKDPKAKGELFGQFVRALYHGQNNPFLAAQYAERSGMASEVAKALGTGTASEGGSFVPTTFAAEFIDMLRPASVFRSANPRLVEFDGEGKIVIPKLVSGVTAGYAGENTNIGFGTATTGDVNLTPKKTAAVTAVSRELMMRSRPGVDGIIRDDLIAGVSEAQDTRLLSANTDSGTAPAGLIGLAPAGNIVTAQAASIDAVTIGIRTLLFKLRTKNVKMRRPVLFMAPRVELWLMTLRDGNGNLVFAPEMNDGTLMRIPYVATTVIPTNLDTSTGGFGDETDIILVDMDQIIHADEMAVSVQASDVAAYHDGTSVVSAFSRDQVAVKVVASHDMDARHNEAIAVLRSVRWGNDLG